MVAMTLTLPNGLAGDPPQRRVGVLALARRDRAAHQLPRERLRRPVAADVDARTQAPRPAQLAARGDLRLGLVVAPERADHPGTVARGQDAQLALERVERLVERGMARLLRPAGA